jgi:Plavaka transposase
VTDDNLRPSAPLRQRVLQYFRTPRNLFGLSRKYYGTEHPSHDPEDHLTLQDLCNSEPTTGTNTSPSDGHPSDSTSKDVLFYPYPNESSLLLGDWYWNHGVQKSQEGFRNLIKIVGNPDFSPSHVRSTNWTEINAILAHNAEDDNQDVQDWLGQDTGWKRTAISINVPFHHRMATPGTQSYLAGELFHRSIVSVIRERVSSDDTHFHYDPYELLWKSTSDAEEVRIHGELYNSAAFLFEHKKLQESPPEPGCDAPRAIIALMFWSDETHLTSFGDAKLWPCYLYFGNDSKYRRAKPSSHLGSHIAYFQTVRLFYTLMTCNVMIVILIFSFRTHSKSFLSNSQVAKDPTNC